MDWALNKYRARIESDQWCQRTTEEETIIALQAQVKKLISTAKTEKKGAKDKKAKAKSSNDESKSSRKGAPRVDGRRFRPKKVNQTPSKRVERNGTGVPITRPAGRGTRSRNAKGLISNLPTTMPRKLPRLRMSPLRD